MAQSGRRLTARPVESEQPGTEINYFTNKVSLKMYQARIIFYGTNFK
jgi:hypothetical protein